MGYMDNPQQWLSAPSSEGTAYRFPFAELQHSVIQRLQSGIRVVAEDLGFTYPS